MAEGFSMTTNTAGNVISCSCGVWNPASYGYCAGCGLRLRIETKPAAPKKRSRYDTDFLRKLDSAIAKAKRPT